ncbi:hypothetical protein [Variovorax sp. GT1P44]|uniref:hypothetical protein n=1 Tax=Variovorax sp. GT1P44 TaxID=3443742 RepID=UPI003F45E97D
MSDVKAKRPALVVTELGTNLVRRARHGHLPHRLIAATVQLMGSGRTADAPGQHAGSQDPGA